MRAESAVESTKSENITVTWRRSAVMSLTGAVTVSMGADGADVVSECRSAIASSRTRRWSTAETPNSFKSSARGVMR